FFAVCFALRAPAIMSVHDWLDPNWRHELTNALLGWIVVGIAAGVFGLSWWALARAPRWSLASFVVVGAVVGAGVGSIAWLLLAHRVDADAHGVRLEWYSGPTYVAVINDSDEILMNVRVS